MVLAAEAGDGWARECAGELVRQERPVAGGWPGTLSEARSRTIAALTRRTGTCPPMSQDSLRTFSQATYTSAKRTWASLCVRDQECLD